MRMHPSIGGRPSALRHHRTRATTIAGCALVLTLFMLVPPAPAQDGDAIAVVNGRPITKQRVVEMLLDAHGLPILQQLIVLELAKSESRRLRLEVTAADVQREFERAMQNIAPDVDATGNILTDVERRQALEMLLQQKGITLAEFMLGMERNAHLRKIVERDFEITEGTLREEFSRLYGEKIECRHIQIDARNIAALQEALNLLDDGTDFAEVARRVSQNTDTAPNGGLLPPFSFSDSQYAPALREAAFALQPGQVSKPIKIGMWWQILRVEQRLPPDEARFEEVRAEVEATLRARGVPQEMNRRITELFRKAEIRILDRELKRKFEHLLREGIVQESTLPR